MLLIISLLCVLFISQHFKREERISGSFLNVSVSDTVNQLRALDFTLIDRSFPVKLCVEDFDKNIDSTAINSFKISRMGIKENTAKLIKQNF